MPRTRSAQDVIDDSRRTAGGVIIRQRAAAEAHEAAELGRAQIDNIGIGPARTLPLVAAMRASIARAEYQKLYYPEP